MLLLIDKMIMWFILFPLSFAARILELIFTDQLYPWGRTHGTFISILSASPFLALTHILMGVHFPWPWVYIFCFLFTMPGMRFSKKLLNEARQTWEPAMHQALWDALGTLCSIFTNPYQLIIGLLIYKISPRDVKERVQSQTAFRW